MLKDAPVPMTINQIAIELNVHANTVRFHLDKLMGTGQVERVRADRHTGGRPPMLFRAVRGMDVTGPRRYRMLAEALTSALAAESDSEAKAVEIGRAWGRQQVSFLPRGGSSSAQPLDRLIALLDQVGFAPDQPHSPEADQIGLRHCPFLELAETQSKIICPIHLGLMQGALETWESPVAVDRLDAFVEPDLCVAHLTQTGAR